MRAAIRDIWAVRWRLARDVYLVVAVLWCVAVATGVLRPSDAYNFHDHAMPDPYSEADYSSGSGFYYAPPIAFLFWPFALLPASWFATVLVALDFAALWYLAGRWAFPVLLLPPVLWEFMDGNVALLIGVCIAVGFRQPIAWAFPLLTRVTPGIGLLWFALRREWRSLSIAIGGTAIVSIVTFAVAPNLWFEWGESLVGNAGYSGSDSIWAIAVPLVVRLPLGVVILVIGWRTDRAWLVPVAAMVAQPVLWWNSVSVAVAAIRVMRDHRPGASGRRPAVIDAHLA